MGKRNAALLGPEYDVVIIGSGCGGLTAGCRLAAGGARALMLEQHNLPGGYASSFVRGRFEFETAIHALADYGSPENPGTIRRLFEEIGVDIPFAFLPDAYHLVLTDDGVDGVLSTGVEAYINDMDRLVPGYRQELRRYFALCQEVMDALNYVEANMENLNKLYLLRRFPNFIRTAAYTVDQVTKKCFNFPESLLGILYSYWGYLGVPTTELNFTVWAAMLAMFHDKMAYAPRNRSHDMSLSLAERFIELGGRVEYNTRVERILVKDGKVAGVETNQGDVITADYVVSNTSPHTVYNHLVHPKTEVPEIAYRYCNSRELGVALFSVYLGMDVSHQELGVRDYEYFIHNTMEKDKRYAVPTEPAVPNRIIMSCINTVVPEASPPGTCILNLTAIYEAGVWDRVTQEEYVALKQDLADQMIAKAETGLHISLRDHIEELEISTPFTLAYYTGHYKGTVYGYKTSVWDSVIPRNLCIEEEEYIKNIEFVGGFSFRGLSYCSSYVSGRIVGDGIIKKMKALREAING
jgi:phytoene dehydrogenase-like protein